MSVSVKFNKLVHKSGDNVLLNAVMDSGGSSKLRVTVTGRYKKDFNYIEMRTPAFPEEVTSRQDVWVSLTSDKRCKFVVPSFFEDVTGSRDAFVCPAYNMDYQYKSFLDLLRTRKVLDLDFWEGDTSLLTERLPFGIRATLSRLDWEGMHFDNLDVITCESEQYIRDSYEVGTVSFGIDSNLSVSSYVKLRITDFNNPYDNLPVCEFKGCQVFVTKSGDCVLRVSKDDYRAVLKWLCDFKIQEESCILDKPRSVGSITFGG